MAGQKVFGQVAYGMEGVHAMTRRQQKVLTWGPDAEAIQQMAEQFGAGARVVMRPDLDAFVQRYFSASLAADVIVPPAPARRAMARASTIAAGGLHVSAHMKSRHPSKPVTLRQVQATGDGT